MKVKLLKLVLLGLKLLSIGSSGSKNVEKTSIQGKHVKTNFLFNSKLNKQFVYLNI